MRSFRDSITPVFCIAIVAMLAQPSCFAGTPAAQALSSASTNSPFYPLSVGNTWTYRCSVEGRFQFTKQITIKSMAMQEGVTSYRVETRVGKDPKPLPSILSVDAKGVVVASFDSAPNNKEPVISSAPRVGERIGNLTVKALDHAARKPFANAETVLLENFSADDPKIPEEKRMQWMGKTYARNIGLIEEADGAGGECVLSKYTLR